MAELRATARPPLRDRALAAFEDAISLLDSDRVEEAAERAAEAKALAPRSGGVRELLGIALYRAERYREALRELQAYRRITGRVDQNHLIADCFRALGAPEKAIEPAREGMGGPAPPDVRAEAAVVGAAALADVGRTAEALGLLRSYPVPTAVRPFDLRVWYMTGEVLERAGRRREALVEFRRVARHDPDAFDTSERIAALEATGES